MEIHDIDMDEFAPFEANTEDLAIIGIEPTDKHERDDLVRIF